MVGHPSRAERRETARQLAKQMLKEKTYKPSRSSVVWTIVSIAIPIAWMETVRGPAVWKLAVGWTLWLIPLVPAVVLMWRWWTGTKKLLAFRYVMVLVIMAGFAAISTWSISDAARPYFLITWPGLSLNDGTTRVYYYAEGRHTLQNPTIFVLDRNNPIGDMTIKPGDIDPRPGGIAYAFQFRPSNLGHERLTIITQSRDVDTNETLSVETRGFALFPAWSAVITNSRTGKIVFECESPDFPEKHGFQACPLNPMAE